MSFEFKGATISARELTIEDEDRITALMLMLPSDESSATVRYRFAEFMVGAQIEGAFDLPIITIATPKPDILAAFQQWRKLPRRIVREWQAEVVAAETPGPKE